MKTRLGKYLRAVAGGATLTVTERGKPVARLAPIPRAEEAVDDLLAEIAALGFVSLSSGEPLPTVEPARSRGEPVERTITRGRIDRF